MLWTFAYQQNRNREERPHKSRLIVVNITYHNLQRKKLTQEISKNTIIHKDKRFLLICHSSQFKQSIQQMRSVDFSHKSIPWSLKIIFCGRNSNGGIYFLIRSMNIKYLIIIKTNNNLTTIIVHREIHNLTSAFIQHWGETGSRNFKQLFNNINHNIIYNKNGGVPDRQTKYKKHDNYIYHKNTAQ